MCVRSADAKQKWSKNRTPTVCIVYTWGEGQKQQKEREQTKWHGCFFHFRGTKDWEKKRSVMIADWFVGEFKGNEVSNGYISLS